MSSTDGSDPYRVLAESRLPGAPRAASPGADPSFKVVENRGVDVVTLLRREYLDGNEIARLGEGLKDYFANQPPAKVVLDMEAVHQISSAALGVIMNLRTAIEGSGAAFCLASVRPSLMEVFKMTNLHKVLKIEAHVADAIANL